MLNGATFVERLSEWAQAQRRERFWSIATTSTGQTVALLPTSSSDFVVGLTDTDGGAITAFASATSTGLPQQTMLVGTADEDPAEYLGTAVVWLRERARDAQLASPIRAQFAFASALLAAAIGDEDGHREATHIAEQLSE